MRYLTLQQLDFDFPTGIMEWMFRHYRALMDLGPKNLDGHRAQGLRHLRPFRMAVLLWNPGAGSEDRLDRHRVWIPDLGDSLIKRNLAKPEQGLVTPISKIRNPGSGTVRYGMVLAPRS
jgi:hypothetical protein